MDRDHAAEERTNTGVGASALPGSQEAPRTGRLWVGGRLVSDPLEAAAALERVRRVANGTNGGADPSALEQTASSLLEQLHVQEAIEVFQQAARLDPRRPNAYSGLGHCYLHLRDHERALQYFEKALDEQADFGKALYGAAVCLLELNRLAEAASYARRLASLAGDEERARGLYVLGLVERARGAWDDAIAHLEESLRAHPHRRRRGGHPGWSEVRHRYELALCYREVNQLDHALEHLRWAASHERRPGPIVRDLADLYLELGRYDDAGQTYSSLLKHNPRDRKAQIGQGRVLLGKRDYRAAIHTFSEVLSRFRDDLDALNGMAEAYKGLGDLDRAARYLEQIKQLYRQPQAQLERRLRALEAERQRRDAELLRIRNIAALNIMATGIAHELRQPLTVIRMAAQNARRDLERGNGTHLVGDLSDIDAGVVRLDKIIAVLRDAASEEMHTDEVVDLVEVVDSALSLFRAQLAHRGIKVDLRLTGKILALGSRVALQQVFINLLSNARDALTETEDPLIQIVAAEDPTHVAVEVRDNGCGMSQAVSDRALDPFFTTKQNGGTGLGLYICHNLIRRMNGSFKIKETSVGRGTTFEIKLRRAERVDHG